MPASVSSTHSRARKKSENLQDENPSLVSLEGEEACLCPAGVYPCFSVGAAIMETRTQEPAFAWDRFRLRGLFHSDAAAPDLVAPGIVYDHLKHLIGSLYRDRGGKRDSRLQHTLVALFREVQVHGFP